MRDAIAGRLERAAREHGIRILHACESGSRAWGFASPDSDYDVRFLYTHDLDWYLRLDQPADTIEDLDDATTIDLAGWELRKALRLFAGCNPTLAEWLDSPTVYFRDEAFLGRLRALVPTYFIPRKAMFHYLGIARGIAAQHLDGNRIAIKKAFYILRPLAATAWIRDLGSMPPTDFRALLDGSPCPAVTAIRPLILDLIDRKAGAIERTPIVLPPPIADYIAEAFPALEAAAHLAPAPKSADLAPLECLFRESVLSTPTGRRG